MPARFIISLDFELHWGVFDHLALDARGRRYFDRTRELIPPTLELFTQYGIRATWATVGILMARDKAQLLAYRPAEEPAYANTELNAYALFDRVGAGERDDPYHFAPSLVRRILDTPGQELGSHTFSHYYCREPGQTAATFAADLAATQRIARDNFGVELNSLVFPRNQYTPDYLEVLLAHGYRNYRTNPDVWFWRAEASSTESLLKKAVRLLDHYLPISSLPTSPVAEGAGDALDAKGAGAASRFLRPYLPKLDAYGGQALKLRRIEREMTAAARAGRAYHLWWHPHNLATDPGKNMAALERILRHYRDLRERYGMVSAGMGGGI